MNLKLWKRGCAALLSGVMMWSQPLCALAESGDSVETTTERQEEAEAEECQEYASSSDASEKETERDSESGTQAQEAVFVDEVELINDLVSEEDLDDELATDSDADEIELTDDLEYDLASGSDADSVELTNDLLVEEVDPEWMTDEMDYTFEWGDLVDGIPEIDFSDYILDGEIDGNAGIAMLSLDSDSDSGNYWSEQIDEDALDYYGLLVDYYDAVTGGSGSVAQTFSLGEVGTFEAAEDYMEEMSNHLDELKYYVYQAIYAFRYDYPMMFWEPTITCGVSVSCYKDADDLYTGVTTGRITITCDLSDSEVYDMVDEITGVIDSFDLSGDTDYAVLKSVHDQICEIADYDDTLAADYAHSAYGALVHGVSVCEGYAKAFKVFCDELGIPCVLIVGQGGSGSSYGAHMWNYVQMDDGLWYGVDVTWDDQDSGILDACFLVGSNTLDTFADTFGNMHIEEPLTIVAGDSTIYLYYPTLAEERYVESEEDNTEIVSIPDENLKAALLETGDTNGDGEMSVAEMEGITYFQPVRRGIVDLTGLEYAVNLEYLGLDDNQVSDISPLQNLTQLNQLVLTGNPISDISALSGLVNLTDLSLHGISISDISALSGLVNLTYLGLSGNEISDITAIQNMTRLETLDLLYNPISDISALSELVNLTTLLLGGNEISDITAVQNLTRLNYLDLSDNQISDISALAGLTDLNILYLNDNFAISDLSSLSRLENLSDLWLQNNLIEDLSPLSGLTNLNTLYLNVNQITDLSSLSGLTNLNSLELGDNQIEDLSPIQSLVYLNHLTVTNNQLTVMPDLTALEGLDLYQDGEPREMFVGNRITRDEFTGKFAENIEVTEAWLDLNSYDGTVVNDDTIVEIPDASLKSALLAAGDTDGDGEMTRTEMSYLDGFGNEWNGIVDLTGLEYAVNLTYLGLNNNEITDLSPLAGLTRLTGLELGWNQIEDLSPLSGLTNLNSIMLDDNQITDISPLQGLTNLTSLSLNENEIGDISPLQGLTNLSSLNLSENEIGDISPLQNLTNLRELWLNNCGLTDISVLANLTQLETLEIQYNQIGDISVLADLTNLSYLDAEGSQITDISPVSELTNLYFLDVGSNQITDISAVQNLTRLSTFYANSNELTTVPDLTALTELILYDDGNPRGMFDGNQIPRDEFTGKFADNIEVTEEWLDLNSYDGTIIEIPDEVLKERLLEAGDSDGDGEMCASEMLRLTSFTADWCGVTDLTGLEYATNLEYLNVSGNALADLAPLSGLTNMCNLDLSYNQITDISALQGMTSMRELFLDNNTITDLSPIQDMTRLSTLSVTYNELTTVPDLTALPDLTLYDDGYPRLIFTGNQILRDEFTGKFAEGIELTEEWLDLNSYDPETSAIVEIPDSVLKSLLVNGYDTNGDGEMSVGEMRNVTSLYKYHYGDEITDLTGLEYATNLTNLNLNNYWNDSYNGISDLSPLSELTSLKSVDLGYNDVTDITPLSGLTNLVTLYLEETHVDDLSALADLTKLETLAVTGGGIQEFSALAGMDSLIYLDLTRNEISDISALADMDSLMYLNLTGNEISDISALAGLTNLIELRLDENAIIDIEAISGLKELDCLYLNDNDITDLSPITNLTNLTTLSVRSNQLTELPYLTDLVCLKIYIEDEEEDDEAWIRPFDMFSGNKITAEEFAGKFADGIELTEEWLDLNSYDGTEVDIPDNALREALLAGYDLDDDGIMVASEMRHIEELQLTNLGIQELTGLEYATKMYYLNLSNNEIADITPLSGLTELNELNLGGNQISDIRALSSLVDLTVLWLNGNQISDISALSDLDMYVLALGYNQISDISALAECGYFNSLYLQGNQISDISTLAGKEIYGTLNLGDNQISDIGALAGIDVADLYLNDNQISDISVLADMYIGWELKLDNNYITDLTPIQNQGDLWLLTVTNNQLTTMPDLTALSWLTLYEGDSPINMFGGNQIPREEFIGKFAEEIELTDEWLDLNSYVSSGEAPIITVQPESAVGEIGDTITFAVEADGAVSYVWYYSADDGNSWKLLKTWEGYDTDTLSFELTSNRLNYLYHCVLTGSDGSTVTTDDVYVQETGLKIVTQPVSVTASIGDTVTYTVEASDAVSYNWYYSADNGDSWKLLKNWEGYNTAELSFEVTSNRLNYLYHCVLTGSDGSTVTTDDVYVQETGLKIVTQPVSVTALIGDTVTYIVEASNAVSYNWYYSADNGDSWKLLKSWEGYDTAELSFEVTSNRLNYLYHCVVKGSDETTLTTDDVYVVEQEFAIVTQPESVAATIGDTVTYTVEASNAVSYSWYYSADNGDSWKLLKSWEGYDTDTLSFEVTSNRLGYLYHCVITGIDGSTLTTDDVYVEEQGFAILTQPESVTASIGDTVTFVTEAAKAVSYGWYYSADGGESWKLLKTWDGYDTDTLSFEVTSNRLNYLYHCVVKDSDGTTLITDAVSIETK